MIMKDSSDSEGEEEEDDTLEVRCDLFEGLHFAFWTPHEVQGVTAFQCLKDIPVLPAVQKSDQLTHSYMRVTSCTVAEQRQLCEKTTLVTPQSQLFQSL